MENHVSFVGAALGLWIVLVVASSVFVHQALFAFLLGVLFAWAFVGYCMFFHGPVEVGGIIHALRGGLYSVLMFHLVAWERIRLRRSTPKQEAPNLALQQPQGSASVS